MKSCVERQEHSVLEEEQGGEQMRRGPVMVFFQSQTVRSDNKSRELTYKPPSLPHLHEHMDTHRKTRTPIQTY